MSADIDADVRAAIDYLFDNLDTVTPGVDIELVRRAVPVIAAHPDDAARQQFAIEVASWCGWDPPVVQRLIDRRVLVRMDVDW